MSLAEATLGLMWVGVTLYAVFAGADFGGGVWDLLAGGARTGAARRALIEHSIGPVWEANHVWLIFVLVVLWTGFPRAFASVTSTLVVPFTAVAVGIILRGSGFAFRKAVDDLASQRVFGAAFASSSLVTPFFLGAVAGAVASGRVPLDGPGDLIDSWVNPTSILGGALAVTVCAYLAAVFLTADARARGHEALVSWFRVRAVVMAVVTGVVALVGIGVLAGDAETLFDGLTGRALPLILLSAAGGIASVGLLVTSRYEAARYAAVVAVVAVLWGWAVGQHPWLLVDELTIEAGAGSRATLVATLWTLGIGAALFAPPLVTLLVMTKRGRLEQPSSLATLAEEATAEPHTG